MRPVIDVLTQTLYPVPQSSHRIKKLASEDMSQQAISQIKLMLLAGTEPDWIFSRIEELHRVELSVGALAHIPQGFLGKFYKHIATQSDCVVFAALEASRVVGFVCGATTTGSLLGRFARFAHSYPSTIIASVLRLIARPGDLRRLLQLAGSLVGHQPKEWIGGPQLLSIAVDRTESARGIGKQLFGGLSDQFSRKGIHEFVVIAAHTQASALAFYRRLGCTPVAETMFGGLPCTVFRYVVPPLPDSTESA